MYMSVPIGSCGSSGPVITLKPLWGSPGTELSTWSTGSICCIRAIQHSRFASRPLRSYTAIQRYTPYRYTSTRMQHRPLSAPVRFGVVCMAEGGGRAFTERSDLWAAQIIDFWLPVVLRR